MLNGEVTTYGPTTIAATKEEVLPLKNRHSSLCRWLDLIFAFYYGQLFTITSFANLIAFIFVAPPKPPQTSMVTLVFRQENSMDLVHQVSVCTALHFGTVVDSSNSVVWYIIYTDIATNDYIAQPNSASLAKLIASYILVTVFCIILAGTWSPF
ncbi:hypothetical protein MPER_03349, partial [Moniliophthora perniciosa FA553]